MASKRAIIGGTGGLPPAWILGGLEPPAGEKDMGGWTAAVYTEEQQKRLNVDECGHKADKGTAVRGFGPAWTRGEVEAPAGEKDMGGWTAAVYTEEQQKRLNLDEFGHAKPAKRTVVGGAAGLPPCWITSGLEPPAGEKDMGGWTAAVYTEEQQKKLGVDEHGHKEAKKAQVKGLGPAWTRGEIEAPAGEKDMGGWTAAVYTEEQQKRLGVDELGHKKKVAVVGGHGGLPPAWVLAGIEAPAGEKDMGGWTAAVFTEEQQKKLGVDEHGHQVKKVQTLGPAWTRGGVEAPAGEKDMGSYKAVVYTEEQQKRLGLNEHGFKVMGLGPAWTRGEAEAPAGEKDMGGYTAAVYTEEQQKRLGVDEFGSRKKRAVVGGAGGLPPAWLLSGLEAPAGEKDMGGWTAAVYTEEQQKKLGVDEHGNKGGAKVMGIGPAWTRGEIEAPAGEKDMGGWTAAVYTEEQQNRLGVDEHGQKKKRAVVGGAGGLPPAWVLSGLEAPAGEKDMGGWTAAVYTEEQQKKLGVDEHGNKGGAKVMGIGPAWTRGEIEAPAGEKDMGGWTAAVYTEEQQKRLGVDEHGQKKKRAVVGGAGGLPPAWVLAGLEAPAGEKDMGGWTAAVFTEEQMARLGVDEHGHKAAEGAKVMGVGPAWTRGEIEAPAGEKDMGGYTAAVYTEEQQKRLGVDEYGSKKKRTVVGGAGGLPPAWVLAGLEAPAGEKDMGGWTAAVYTEEQQKRLGVDEQGHKSGGVKVMGLGPAWTRGETEAPAGEKDMGGYTAAVYTEEQQKRLGVDEYGEKKAAKRAVVGGQGGLPPSWITDGLEPPAGEKDMGGWTAAVYTEEQQKKLGVDEHGHKEKSGGVGTIGPAWTRGEIEAPAGEKDMGGWTAAVYTEEQQKRLGVDEFGHKK